jgi:hypothetical protein
MNNKRILPLLLLAGALILGVIIPGAIFANRSGGIGSLSPQATATARPSVAQAELQLDLNPNPDPTSTPNCTYTIGYWINQPELWPPEVSLGGVVYTREDAYLALVAEDDDIWNIVLKEAYVVLLNIYHGASRDRIETTLMEADDWLRKNPAGSDLSQFNQQQGLSFANQLSDFNNGLLWPRSCPDQIINTFSQEASLDTTPTLGGQQSISTPQPAVVTSPDPGQVSPPAEAAPPPPPEPTSPPAEIPPSPPLDPTSPPPPPPPDPTSPPPPPPPDPTSPPPPPSATVENIAPTQAPPPTSDGNDNDQHGPGGNDNDNDNNDNNDDDDDDDDDD